MGKLVVLVIVLGSLAIAGYFGYQRFLAPAGPRACATVVGRCGLAPEQASACEKVVAEVRENAGADAAKKLTTCLLEADSCSETAGCVAGLGLGALSRSVLEFANGLRRAN